MQEAHHAQPVGNGNNDDIRILLHEIDAVKNRVDSSACLKGTAVNPNHNGFLPGSSLI